MLRSELYELVWSSPVVNVAQLLEISASHLKDLCRDHDVPTPGRGHWAKVKAGQEVERAPLPSGADVVIPVSLPAMAAPAPVQVDQALAEVHAESHPAQASMVSGAMAPAREVRPLDAELQLALSHAAQHEQFQVLRQYLVSLEAAAARLDAARRNAVLVWVQGIHRSLSEADPITRSVERAGRVLGGLG